MICCSKVSRALRIAQRLHNDAFLCWKRTSVDELFQIGARKSPFWAMFRTTEYAKWITSEFTDAPVLSQSALINSERQRNQSSSPARCAGHLRQALQLGRQHFLLLKSHHGTYATRLYSWLIKYLQTWSNKMTKLLDPSTSKTKMSDIVSKQFFVRSLPRKKLNNHKRILKSAFSVRIRDFEGRCDKPPDRPNN